MSFERPAAISRSCSSKTTSRLGQGQIKQQGDFFDQSALGSNQGGPTHGNVGLSIFKMTAVSAADPSQNPSRSLSFFEQQNGGQHPLGLGQRSDKNVIFLSEIFRLERLNVAQMISAVFVSTLSGDLLISQGYTDDIPDNYVDRFWSVKNEAILPEQECQGMWFYNIKRSGLYFVAASKSRQCGFTMIEALSRLYSLLKDFCGCVNEDTLRLNFILVQELLLEFIEQGYVQLSAAEKLKSYIYSEAIIPKSGLATKKVLQPGLGGLEKPEIPCQAANKPIVMSRSSSSLHRNEIFLDVIEHLSVVINKEGTCLRSEVAGRLTMKNFIANSISVKLGLNEDLTVGLSGQDAGFGGSVHFDECSFFDNVSLDTWISNRTAVIQAIPGEHNVMNYHINSKPLSFLPFRLIYDFDRESPSRDLDLKLVLRCMLPQFSKALQVTAHLPIPRSTSSVMSQLSGPEQEVQHVSSEKRVLWKIRDFGGNTEAVAKLKLVDGNTSSGNLLELGPLALEFELSAYVCSGLKIRFLLLCTHKPGESEPFRWVRYITYSNSYVFRLL